VVSGQQPDGDVSEPLLHPRVRQGPVPRRQHAPPRAVGDVLHPLEPAHTATGRADVSSTRNQPRKSAPKKPTSETFKLCVCVAAAESGGAALHGAAGPPRRVLEEAGGAAALRLALLPAGQRGQHLLLPAATAIHTATDAPLRAALTHTHTHGYTR